MVGISPYLDDKQAVTSDPRSQASWRCAQGAALRFALGEHLGDSARTSRVSTHFGCAVSGAFGTGRRSATKPTLKHLDEAELGLSTCFSSTLSVPVPGKHRSWRLVHLACCAADPRLSNSFHGSVHTCCLGLPTLL